MKDTKNRGISAYLAYEEILCQLAEEASELAQAALKLRRAMNRENPTPKSEPQCRMDLEEEIADVYVCLGAMGKYLNHHNIENHCKEKSERWLRRLRKARKEET